MAKEVAILGVGMHPWGKWGKNFVEYGIKACNDALDDAGLEWQDIEVVAGAETVRNGYAGYVAGAPSPRPWLGPGPGSPPPTRPARRAPRRSTMPGP